jgi:hypothetical protein
MSLKNFPLTQSPTPPQELNHEQRRIFLEKISQNFSGQSKPQSENRHPANQIRTGKEIGIYAGSSGTYLGFDTGYGNFYVG